MAAARPGWLLWVRMEVLGLKSKLGPRRLLAVWLALSLVWTAPVAVSASGAGQPDPAAYQRLQELIRTTPLEQFDLNKFKEIYQSFDDAPGMLKTILGESGHDIPQKSKRLGELRKFYDWSIQAEYARDNNVIVENTNQGKDNGGRSDLDATANVLEAATDGPGGIRDRQVKALQRYHRQRYVADGFTSGSETVDVSLFNGDAWLPDWRDARMSYQEFRHKLIGNVYDIRRQPGAYYVPGAHKEQAHDRALKEGHTIHIGWDFVNNMPSVNGLPIVFDAETGRVMQLEVDADTGKILEPRRKTQLVEYVTSEARGVVKRYSGISELHGPDKWRRSFGNLVQNWYESLTHSEPISRNKYFIERIVDQAMNKVANVNGTYVELEKSGADAATKETWKRAFIERAFGVEPGSQRYAEIKSVLDRSAQIQIDYKAERPYNEMVETYYGEEIRQVRERNAGNPDISEQQILRQAEAEFVSKQRRITIEGGLKVIEHTFGMEFTAEGIRRNTHDFASPEVAHKIMTERGVELALFLDMVESAPLEPAERARLRERAVEAIPREARTLALRMAELAGLKMDLMGRQHLREAIYGERTYVPPSQLLAEVEADMSRLVGDVDAAPRLSRGEALRYLDGIILSSLGPVHGADYIKAMEAGNRGMQAKYAGLAYWNEIKAQADLLWGTMAALAMVNSYQQHCAGQVSWSDDCLIELGSEGFTQVLFLLPIINTGLITKGGLEALGRGDVFHGAVGVGLGLASIPAIAARLGVTGAVAIKAYILVMTVELGVAVTYGYAVQLMENDFLEQAFKSQPEPGKQARAYDYPARPSVFRADTPTTPILQDVIEVEADDWSARRRARLARGMFSADIQAELLDLGIDPASPAWDQKADELALRYGQIIPYTLRMAEIFETFGPRVEAKIAEMHAEDPTLAQDFIGFEVCMEVKRESIEKKYAEPPGIWDQIRFWADRTKEKNIEYAIAQGQCVAQSVDEDEAFLRPVFEEYVDSWFARQSSGYQFWVRTDERRNSLVETLMREYVVHRALHERQEQADLLAQAEAEAKRQAERRLKILSALAHAETTTRDELGADLLHRLESVESSARDAYDVEPEVILAPPPYAVRLGSEGQVDFEAKGRRYAETDGEGPEANRWQAVLQSEIAAVTLEEPANLLRTEVLEEELAAGRGEQAKQFVTIEEKLTGELRNGAERVLASAEATVTHFEILEWAGNVTVEVRAAGESTTDPSDPSQTSPYSGAPITLSGPSSAEGVSEGIDWTGHTFGELEPGAYSIRVEPREGDERHQGAEGQSTLVEHTVALGATPGDDDDLTALTVGRSDPANPDARVVLVTWKDRDSITVVLPYQPPEPPDEAESDEGDGGSGGAGPAGDDEAPDPAVVQAADTAAQAAAERAAGSCEAAESAAQSAGAEAARIAAAAGSLGGRTDAVEQSLGAALGAARDALDAAALAEAAARRLAEMRDEAARLRETACTGARRIAEAGSMEARRRIMSEVTAAVDQLRELSGQAPSLLERVRRAHATAEAARQQLARALAELAGLEQEVAALQTASAATRAEVDGAESSIDEAAAAAAELQARHDQVAAMVGGEATGSGAGAPSPTPTEALARIETAQQQVADCPARARAALDPVAQTLTESDESLRQVGERLAGIRAEQVDEALLEQLATVVSEADATLALAEPFAESIQNRADDASLCAELAEGSMTLPIQTIVPEVRERPYGEAAVLVSEAALVPQKVDAGPAPAADREHWVIDQSPPAGRQVEADTVVALRAYGELERVTVPPLRGQSLDAARGLLTPLDLTLVVANSYEPDDAARQFTVIDQSPGAGARVERGGTVSVDAYGRWVEPPPPPPPPIPRPGSDDYCVAFYNYLPFAQGDAGGGKLKKTIQTGGFAANDYRRTGDALHMEVAPGAAPRESFKAGSKYSFPFKMAGQNPKDGQPIKLDLPLLLESAGTGDNCAELQRVFPAGEGTEPIRLGEDGTFTQTMDRDGQQVTISGGPLEEGWSDEAIAGNIAGLAAAIELFDCFIATSVYRQADTPALRSLRRFRDEVLLASPAGSRLVVLYYRIGPRAAAWLKHRPRARRWLRPALDLVASGLDRLPTDSRLVRRIAAAGSRVLESVLDTAGLSRLPAAPVELFNPLDPASALPLPVPGAASQPGAVSQPGAGECTLPERP